MEQDFLKHIKDKSNQLNIPTGAGQWKKLENRLDSWQHSQRPKRRGFFHLNIFWLAAAVVGILMIASFAVFVYPKQEKPLAFLSATQDTKTQFWKKVNTEEYIYIQFLDKESVAVKLKDTDSTVVLKKNDIHHFISSSNPTLYQLDISQKDTLRLTIGKVEWVLVR